MLRDEELLERMDRGASLFFDLERFLEGPYRQDPAEEALSHLGTG